MEATQEATKGREGTPMVTKQVDKFEDGHLESLLSQKSFWGKPFIFMRNSLTYPKSPKLGVWKGRKLNNGGIALGLISPWD